MTARSYSAFGVPLGRRGETGAAKGLLGLFGLGAVPAGSPGLGEQMGGAGQAQATFGYQGELTVTGQVDLRARTYDPVTGRFTSVDPMAGTPGDVLAANPYPYAANDPLDQSDPTGQHPINEGDFNFGLWNAWSWDYGYGGMAPGTGDRGTVGPTAAPTIPLGTTARFRRNGYLGRRTWR